MRREQFSITAGTGLWTAGGARACQCAWVAARLGSRMSLPRFAWGFLVFACLGLVAVAQPLVSPSPLTPAAAEVPSGPWIAREIRANHALQAGFAATAAAGYREILADPALPVPAQARVILALVTALLDAADLRGAEAALTTYAGPRDSAFQLRAGLVAAHAGRWAQARAALEAGRPEDLPHGDRGWWFFLQALVADGEGDFARANNLYEQAANLAGSELARVRFLLSQEQARLRVGQVSEAQLATYRGNMERHQGTPTGYIAARTYAVGLHLLKRSAEAEDVLRRQLDALPPTERESADQLRLVLGLIAGETTQTGRRSFTQLLERAQRTETQQIALQLLVRGAQTSLERQFLRGQLTELLRADPPHPIAESLLLARAQVGLTDGLYAGAEEDARALLEKYPSSPLRPAALGVRLSVAWEQRRYRTVADVVAQLRTLLADGEEKAELGVLLAEAFFRAEDYPSAADAYDAALREPSPVAPAGMLIFQRVLAEIRSGRADRAATLLDEVAVNPSLDPVSRWRAEWNLVKHLQVQGLAAEALARVNRLLGAGAGGVAPELRVRLLWLQADLSFDLEKYEEALRLADALLAEMPGATELDQRLREEVVGNTLLLKAQALLALGREADGTAVFQVLREQHRGTPASTYSFIIQAARLSRQGQLADAQKVLTDLADSDKESEFAPLALYEAALNAERQGLDRNLREAHNLLERIKREYPRDELRFYAMVKQGDLLRQMNDFAAARQVYEEILINYAQHAEVLLAQLALADTLFALGANSVVNYESAAALFERLRDLPTAPVDLRAEAGFKWGYALARRGSTDRAAAVLWSVVDTFLFDADKAGALGPKGRYWVARALLELGQLHEDAGRLEEAREAYALIVERRLGGAAQAQAKLERYRPAPEPRPRP